MCVHVKEYHNVPLSFSNSHHHDDEQDDSTKSNQAGNNMVMLILNCSLLLCAVGTASPIRSFKIHVQIIFVGGDEGKRAAS